MSERKTTDGSKPASKRLRLNATCGATKSLGFSTAAALLDATNRVDNPNEKKSARSVDTSTAKSGFCSAAAVLKSPELINSEKIQRDTTNNDVQQQQQQQQQESEAKNAHDYGQHSENQPSTDFQIFLTCVGWKYHKDLHDESFVLSEGTSVVFEREADNEYDSNAIAVLSVNRIKIGHVTKEDAARLAPHMDSETIQFSNISIHKCFEASFLMVVKGVTNGPSASMAVANRRMKSTGNVVSAGPYSWTIAKADVERSKHSPYMLNNLKELPWNPLPDWKASTDDKPSLSWLHPFDPSTFHSPPLSMEEIRAASSASWPPADEILLRLGMAPANDKDWWQSVAGLLPPDQWKVDGALDVLPHIKLASRSQASMASSILDGAMHGVTGVWHLDTLVEMGELMHEPSFWSRRGEDALIRSFGGPYVLGQQENKLKLVRGAPHSELTQKMCVAHNLVYAAVHLVHPASPGFNTLIFGCNLRGAGFHFHQDAVPSLKAKNAPLVNQQPVVTTVFYEKPNSDSGKEIVMWKPILNFSPVGDKSHGTGEYLGTRCVRTLHGMVHVQRAGLQKSSLHGIFHAPHSTDERQGYRVAITARITKPNAEDTLSDYLHTYTEQLGPDGDLQLCPKGN